MKLWPFARSCVTPVWMLLLLLLLPSLLLLLTTPAISLMLGQMTQPRSRRCVQRQDRAGPVFSFRGFPSQADGSFACWDSRSTTTTEASAHCSEEECLDHVVIAPPSWLLCNVT